MGNIFRYFRRQPTVCQTCKLKLHDNILHIGRCTFCHYMNLTKDDISDNCCTDVGWDIR